MREIKCKCMREIKCMRPGASMFVRSSSNVDGRALHSHAQVCTANARAEKPDFEGGALVRQVSLCVLAWQWVLS